MIGSIFTNILSIPKSSADGYVFSGSWATILTHSLRGIGIMIDAFRKDHAAKADILTIRNAKGETQTIVLKAFASMNVIKFKKLIRIQSA